MPYLSLDPKAGLQQDDYLSTDPNAGLGDYLSTDPNAGLSQQEEGPSLLGRAADVVGRVGNTLGRLGASTAAVAKEGLEGYQQGQSLSGIVGDSVNAVKDTFTPTGIGTFKRTTDFNDVLGQAGMEEGWGRSALGFGLDVVVDPLNLVPGAVLAKGIKAPVNAAGKVLKAIPGVETAANVVKKTFVPHAGLEKYLPNTQGGMNLKDTVRLHESTLRHEGEAATTLAENFMGETGIAGKVKSRPLTKDEATKILYAVDNGVTSLGDARLDQGIQEWNQIMADQAQTKLKMGTIDQSQVLPNYVPYQTKTASADAVESISGANLRGKTASDKAREKFQNLTDAVTVGGASDNATEVLSKYVSQTQKAKRTNDFLTLVGQEFGKKVGTSNTRTLNRKMFNVPDQTWAALEGNHFDKEVADHLEKAVQLWEKPSEIDHVGKTAMKVWKSMATSINPGHHFTNLYGNIQNMYISGMSTKDIAMGYAKGWKIAREQSPKAFDQIRNYSPDQLFKLANDYEMLGTSNMLTDLGEGVSDKLVNFAPFKWGRQFGTKTIEEPARLGMWLDQIKKGKTPEQAAIRVKDVLFDYAELTDAEKKLRDTGLIPFYTWMRKNIPYQIQSMVDNPKQIEKLKDLTNVPWNANETEVENTVIPEKVQNASYMPGPMTGPNGEMVMNKLNLPINDLNRLTDPATIGDMLGPLAKIPIEFTTGEKFFGGPVKTPDGLAAPAPAAAMLGTVANRILPESMQGYVTPTTDALGRQRQHDVAAWLMNNLLPTGVYGSTAKMMQNDDPMRPEMNKSFATLAKILGLSPDVISAQDQKFEVLDRKKEWSREQKRKALLEK